MPCSVVLGVSSLGGSCDGLTDLADKFERMSLPDKPRFGIINSVGSRSKNLQLVSSLDSLASLWKEPAARTPYMPSFIALMQRLHPLVASKKVNRLFVCASAPRAALTVTAGRWLASFCAHAKHHDVPVLWVDTSSATASAATFKFGCSLSLIPLPLLSTSSASLTLPTFFMSSETSLTRRLMNWYKGKFAVHCTFLWRQEEFIAEATTFGAEFAWTRLHSPVEKRGWIVIPSRVGGLTSVVESGHVVLARYKDRHLALVPVTSTLFMVYSMTQKVYRSLPTVPLPSFDSECDIDDDPLVLVQPTAPVSNGAMATSSLRDDIAKCAAGVASDSPRKLAIPRKTVANPPPKETVKKVKKPRKPAIDISKIPEGMDITSFRRSHVLNWYNKMMEGKLSCKIASRALRDIECCLRTTKSAEERSAVKKEMAAILRKEVVRVTRHDVLDVPDHKDKEKLKQWDLLRKAQCLSRFEMLRLEGSRDRILKVELDSIRPLIVSLGISRLDTDNTNNYTRVFLDHVVYKQYGLLFPKSIVDLYDYFDHEPPPILLGTPSPVVESKPPPVVRIPRKAPVKRTAKVPVELTPSGPPTLSAKTAALLDDLKSGRSRQPAFRADVTNTARTPPKIMWRRPKNFQVLLDSELRPKKKPQFPVVDRRNLKTSAWRRHDRRRPVVMEPESPIRVKKGRPMTFSPNTNARLVRLGLMVLESPLPDRKRKREEDEEEARPTKRISTRTKLEFASSSDED